MFNAVTRAKIRTLSLQMLPNVDPAATLAVVDTESGGKVFWRVGGANKPPVRFEGHYFNRLLSGSKLKKAQSQGLAHPKAGRVKNPNSYAARYELVERAARIDQTAAYESCSWGLGQVMGVHWSKLGYESVQELVNDCYTLEGQVRLMLRYVIKFDLEDELRRQDWHGFARFYNGPAYKRNRYAAKMAAAFDRYAGKANKNEGTIYIQKMLKTLGYYKSRVDGIPGPLMQFAVERFQKDHGLVVDGDVGPMTLEELEDAHKEHQGGKGDTNVDTGIGGVGVGGIGSVIMEQVDQIMPLGDYSPMIKGVLLLLLVVGVGLIIYGKVRKKS